MGTDDLSLKEHLRSVLQARPRRTCEQRWLRCAAVLVPLLRRDDGWHVTVTQRTQAVEHHKGQISFPGGKCDPGDAGVLETALREAYEEIGIQPADVDVLGELDCLQTVSDFSVAPVVGAISHPYPYRLNPREVEAVVEVPLPFLLDPRNQRTERREVRGQVQQLPYWEFGPYTIWGATARILRDLLDLLP